jgi:hypothetical protein
MSTVRVALSLAAVSLTAIGIIQSAELSTLDAQLSGIRGAYALPHLPERIAVGILGSQVISIIIENGQDPIIPEAGVEAGSLKSRILVNETAVSY